MVQNRGAICHKTATQNRKIVMDASSLHFLALFKTVIGKTGAQHLPKQTDQPESDHFNAIDEDLDEITSIFPVIILVPV